MWLALFLGSLHIVSEPAWQSSVGSKTLPHKVGPNENVRDLSGGDYDTPNLIDCVMCVGV